MSMEKDTPMSDCCAIVSATPNRQILPESMDVSGPSVSTPATGDATAGRKPADRHHNQKPSRLLRLFWFHGFFVSFAPWSMKDDNMKLSLRFKILESNFCMNMHLVP